MNNELVQVLMERLNLTERQALGAISIITSYMESHVPEQNRGQLDGLLGALLGGGALSGVLGQARGLFGDNSRRGPYTYGDNQFGVDDVVRGLGGLFGTPPNPNARFNDPNYRRDNDGLGMDDVMRGLGDLLGNNRR